MPNANGPFGAISDFAAQHGGYGAKSYAELRRWALRHYKDRPGFSEVKKALSELKREVKGSGRGPFQAFSQVDGGAGLSVNPSTRGVQVNRGLIKAGEEEAWARSKAEHMVIGGQEIRAPRLPSGRALTWGQQRELKGTLQQGYGIDEMIRRYGAPVGAAEQGVFHYVVDPADAEGRAYARFAFAREELVAAAPDERLAMVAATQASFQITPEGPLMSGGRETLKSVERISKQVEAFPTVAQSRVVFDLETASLIPEHGIRQLSYRVTDANGRLVRNETLDFANDMMGIGHWGQPVDDFLKGEAGGRKLYSQDDLAEKMLGFFEEANKADLIVGQNANFDINMLMHHARKSGLYKRGEEIIAAGGDPRLLAGRDSMALRMKMSTDTFLTRASGDRFVDTAAHARNVMANVGGNRLSVAPEILRKGEAKLFSIENVLLQSSFMEDVINHGLATPGEMRGILSGGLHAADVDTWFTDMLYQLQAKAYAGETFQGKSVLRAAPLSDAAYELIHGQAAAPGAVRALRHGISAGSAVTPFHTILDRKQIQPLVDAGILDEAAAGTTRVTALEQMMLLSRDISMTPGAVDAKRLALRGGEGGVWDNFLKQFPFLAEDGGLAPRGPFPQLADAKLLHKAAQEAGLPFAGLSPFERAMSTLMGKTTVKGDLAFSHMRSLIGDVAPVGVLQSPGLKVFPQAGPGRTVAMPLQMLQEMEKTLDAGGNQILRGTSLGKAEARSGLQWLTLSPFESTTDSGHHIKDVAFNVRGVIGKETADEDIGRIMKYLRELSPEDQARLGVTIDPQMLGRVKEALHASGATMGIQVGTLGNTAGTHRLYNLMHDLGFAVDRENGKQLAAPLLTTGPGGRTVVGPIHHMAAGVAEGGEAPILAEVKRLIGGEEGKMGGVLGDLWDLSGDERFMTQIGRASEGKLADAPVNFINTLKKHLTKTNVAIGLGVGAAAYYLLRKKDPKPGEETLADQPFEAGDFYARYQQETGGERLAVDDNTGRKAGDTLRTAGLMGGLDARKIGHHRMGPSKDRHLFGG